MDRKTALIGHLQPIDSVAVSDVTSLSRYLDVYPLPSFALDLEPQVKKLLLEATNPRKSRSLRKKAELALASELVQKGKKTSNSGTSPSAAPFAPLALLSVHRQIFDAVVDSLPMPGPIEQVFTVAPKETVEVRLEEVRRRTYEESKETSTSVTEEQSSERKSSQEFTDRFLDRVERSSSATLSANAAATFGIVSGGIGGSKTWADSQTKAIEKVGLIANEISQRTAQAINRSFSVRTRSTEEITQSNSYRKLIQNDTENPINYGLLRYFRKLTIRTQILGRYLCWRFTLPSPGRLLAQPAMLSDPIVPNGSYLLPGVPAKQGFSGTDVTRLVAVEFPGINPSASEANVRIPAPMQKSVAGQFSYYRTLFVKLTFAPSGDAYFVGLISRSGEIRVKNPNLGVGGTSYWRGQYRLESVVGPATLASGGTATCYMTMLSCDPIPADWPTDSTDLDGFVEAFRKDILVELEQKREVINGSSDALRNLLNAERSAPKRPERDLRLEEAWAVEAHVLGLLGGNGASSDSGPGGTSFSHLFAFDLMHATPSGFVRGTPERYTALEGQYAPLGSSLGWRSAFDADEPRNRFINAENLEVVLPICIGREREAISVLAFKGYVNDGGQNTLEDLLKQVEASRMQELAFLGFGPDDVIAEHKSPDLPKGLEQYYAVSNARELVIPVEGFGYRRF